MIRTWRMQIGRLSQNHISSNIYIYLSHVYDEKLLIIFTCNWMVNYLISNRCRGIYVSLLSTGLSRDATKSIRQSEQRNSWVTSRVGVVIGS